MNEKFNFKGKCGNLSSKMNKNTLPMQSARTLPKEGIAGLFRDIVVTTIETLRKKGAEACILVLDMTIILKANSLGIDLNKYDPEREAIKLAFVGDVELACNGGTINGILGTYKNVELFLVIDAVNDRFLLGGEHASKDKFFEDGDLEEASEEELIKNAEEFNKKVEEENDALLNNIDLNKELGLDDKGICLN